jgi:hypothetical protein
MKIKLTGSPAIGVFFCPGCQEEHAITIRPAPPDRPAWEFDGNLEAPTLNPSILRTWRSGVPEEHPDRTCHSFVRAGKIEFLGDCTHALRGQTVELPEVEAWACAER